MVLQKQLIQIPFGGLQTKADPKVAPLGTYQNIDNFIMKQYPELVKRDGLSFIGTSTVPENISTAYTYINEMGVITNAGLYSYSPAIDQFQLKGKTASPVISSKPVIANTYTQTVCDSSITSSNILGSIWEDSRGGVRCSVKDMTSDTFLTSDYSLSATGVKPKVVAAGTQILFLWVETGTTTLKVQQYNTITNTFYVSDSITASLASSYTYDAIKSLNNVLIAAATTAASPDVIMGYYWNVFTHALGTGGDGTAAPNSFAITNSGATPPAISLATDPTNVYVTCTVYNNSKQIYTKTVDSFLNPLTSELQVASATTDAGYAVASCIDSSFNTYIYYSSYSSMHNSFQALVTSSITTPAVSYNRVFFLQMGVATKAFYYDSNAHVVLAYTSALQATYFGVRDDGACFGRFFSTLGGGNVAKANCISSFTALPAEDNTYVTALLKTTKIISSNTSFYTTTSVFTEKIFFTPYNIDNKVLGKNLNIAGGYLKQYDGSPTVFEQGYHLYPEAPTLLATAIGTGHIVAGTYSYIVCWEWVDNQGQLVRSEPSVPTSITLGATDDVTVTIRSLPITNKETRFEDVRTPIVAAVYRTLTGGTSYYRVNQLTSTFVYNSPTAQTITFTDIYTDAQISSNALLYTTGGVYQNICLPSTNLMTVGKNRVIVAGTDTEPNRVFFSKEKEEGIGVEFSNELSFIVDSLGGDITALAAMDDKIIIFKKSLVYYVAGQGPDKLGNGSFTIPLLISSDCGCNTPQSVVLTGLGIMFQSQKGIYLLDRQLNVTYIGQQVDRIVNQSENFQITSAVNLPDQNLVYFTDLSNQVLVYDTYFQQWYTQTLKFSPISATILDNVWYATSLDTVSKSVLNQAFDDASPIISTLKTNWISLAQMEGFARIYAILLLGDNAQLAHTLKVNLYYDFEDYPRETLTITPTSLLGPVFGTDATYGLSTPFGGLYDGTYQFTIRPREQKCSSICIEILDSFPTGALTQSFKFSGISIVAGIKQGWNKGLSYTTRLT